MQKRVRVRDDSDLLGVLVFPVGVHESELNIDKFHFLERAAYFFAVVDNQVCKAVVLEVLQDERVGFEANFGNRAASLVNIWEGPLGFCAGDHRGCFKVLGESGERRLDHDLNRVRLQGRFNAIAGLVKRLEVESVFPC